MIFQVLDTKDYNFMNLLNKNSNSITAKGSPWLKFFDYSNSLCTRATRAIVNHASIGKY